MIGFMEKPPGDDDIRINDGFSVLNLAVTKYIAGEDACWEGEPVNRLVETGGLSTFEHHGLWQSMDMLCDKSSLEAMWQLGSASWKKW